MIGQLKLESGDATGLSVSTGNENISLKVTGETNLTVSSGNGSSYGISISSNSSSKASADVTLQKTIIKSDVAAKHHIASGIWVYGGYNPLPGGDHEAGAPSKLTVSGDLDLSVSGAYVITGITAGSMYKNNSYPNGIVELRGANNVIRIVGDNTDVEVGEPQGGYSRAVGVLAYENGKVSAEGKTKIDVSSNYRLVPGRKDNEKNQVIAGIQSDEGSTITMGQTDIRVAHTLENTDKYKNYIYGAVSI